MKIAQEFVDNTLGELWDVEVRVDYSGRGMSGKQCLALVTNKTGWGLARDVREALEYATNGEEEDLLDYILSHEPRGDNMGFSTVYYWPSVQVTED